MSDPGRFPALMFDRDGVLLDSEPRSYQAVNLLLAEHGSILSEDASFHLVGTTGRSASAWISDHVRLPSRVEDGQARSQEAVFQARAEPLEPLPGARERIAAARSRGLLLGLASASPDAGIEALLRGLGPAPAFAPLVSGTLVEHGTPAPDMVLLVAARLGVPAASWSVREDAEPGVRAARAAGMVPVQLRATSAAAPPLPDADFVLTSLRAFPLPLLERRPS